MAGFRRIPAVPVKRATLYGHLDKTTIGGQPHAPKDNTANNPLRTTAHCRYGP
jgi:hypothetical protein